MLGTAPLGSTTLRGLPKHDNQWCSEVSDLLHSSSRPRAKPASRIHGWAWRRPMDGPRLKAGVTPFWCCTAWWVRSG